MAKFINKSINDDNDCQPKETQVLLLEHAEPEDQKPSSAASSDTTPEIIITTVNSEGLTGEPQPAAVIATNPTSEENWQLLEEPTDYEWKEGGRRRYGTYKVQDGEPSAAKKSKRRPNRLSDGSLFYKDDRKRTEHEEAALYVHEGEANVKFTIHPSGKWSKWAFHILHSPVYHVFNLCVCTLLLLIALVEHPSAIPPHISPAAKTVIFVLHDLLEVFLLAVIWLDMMLRLLWFRCKHFFTHKRTIFVLFILVVISVESTVVIILSLVQQKHHHHGEHLIILRALRPVFFIDTYLMGGVRRVLRQILLCVKPILNVLILMMLVLVVFSLLAYLIFAETDTTYFHSFSKSLVSFFVTMTTANHPDVLLEAYARQPASPLFFVIYIVIMVYLITNVLLAVVYTAFKEADKKKFKQLFLHKTEALRLAFEVLESCTPGKGIQFHDFLLFMHHYRPRVPEWRAMCMFKALHKDPSQCHKELSLEEFYGFYKVRDFKWKLLKDDGEEWMWFEHHRLVIKTPARLTYKLIKSPLFNIFINVVLIANLLFLVVCSLFITEEEVGSRYLILNNKVAVSLAFVSIYVVEISLRVFGIGLMYFFRKPRNLIDGFIIFTSFILLIVEASSPAYAVLAVFRPIKFLRLLRLKRRYRDIMRSLVMLGHRLFSIGILLLTIYYFFAIIGMEAFDDNVGEKCCNGSWYNVGEFYSGNNRTFSSNVYYLLNFDDILNSYLTLFVLMVVNNWYIIMEGFASTVRHAWIARLYFMAFYIITLVVLQVVISFIVDAFEIGILVVGEDRLYLRHHPHDYHKARAHKKVTTVKLLYEDIQKLKNEIATNDKTPTGGNCFSRFIRRLRRKKLDHLSETQILTCTGRRLRTKDDVHLMMYKDNLNEWMEERERELLEQMEEDGSKMKQACKKLGVYIIKCVLFIVE